MKRLYFGASAAAVLCSVLLAGMLNRPSRAAPDNEADHDQRCALLQAAGKAEQSGDFGAALLAYETLYDSTATDEPKRAELRAKFASLRPKVSPNTDPEKAGTWKVRAFAFRELDFTWKDKQGNERRAQHRYRADEIERLRRSLAGFAERVWQFTDGQLRIDWTLNVIERPLTRLDGDDSFWPGPDACMPHLADLKPGEVDTIMVFTKVWGDPNRGETGREVPQMLLGGALGVIGDVTKGATYIGFNWGSGAVENEPEGEPMLHEWLHSAQWALEDYQAYPRGLMFTSDGGRMEDESGGDLCYRRKKSESSWMGFYEHLMRTHVTRRMWRELSIRRPADNVWIRAYCRSFLVLGPFDATGKPNMGLDFGFIDEDVHSVTPSARLGGRLWQAMTTSSHTLDLASSLGSDSGRVAYVAVRARSETEQPAQLRVGSDDGCKVWHNGHLVLCAPDPRSAEPDQNIVPVTLAKGDNLILLKVANVGGGWATIVRLTDAQGSPLAGLTYSNDDPMPVRDESTNPGVPWPATDALGRRLPLVDEVGPAQTNRFVGIFYFLWHNQRGGKSPNWDGPYDIGRIIAQDPDALKKPDSPLWGPIGMYHYWGEPLYGYYLSTDPWVLRRHAQLLADAGIDTLIFDTTNALSYPEVYRALCAVFRRVREEGGRTPQFAFMVNTKAGETAQQIYRDLYQPGLYRELWFYWRGKPLLICDPAAASAELRKFFTLRRAHWPFTLTNTPYAWHWEATYPQPYGYTDDPQQPEQVNVSVAQNLRQADGKVTNMSAGDARGRSFHDGRQDTTPGAVNHGYNAQEQWRHALDLKPPFVMVTGWNEWIAGRWGKPGGPLVFVDQFDQEFSRDIEPVKGAHGDNYYWQLVANVRRFKGAPPLPSASPPKSIRTGESFDSWRDVAPEFRDWIHETAPRDFDGSAGLHYTNRTGRNDLAAFKVARDAQMIYFYARTREALTAHTDPNWMWLLIDADQNAATGWQGYDFIVNRSVEGEGKTWLEKNEGGWNWRPVLRVDFRVRGNELQLAIPRSALGLPQETNRIALDFKWADNIQHPGDIMDFYVSGDVAPEGRFNFRYQTD